MHNSTGGKKEHHISSYKLNILYQISKNWGNFEYMRFHLHRHRILRNRSSLATLHHPLYYNDADNRVENYSDLKKTYIYFEPTTGRTTFDL